jgi:uncharacterized protein YdeI (YjbR/CyaY-like superfamily)
METQQRYDDLGLDPDAWQALSSAGLIQRFEDLSAEYRHQHYEWIAKATQPEARRYRITEMCEMLSPEDRLDRPSDRTVVPEPTD